MATIEEIIQRVRDETPETPSPESVPASIGTNGTGTPNLGDGNAAMSRIIQNIRTDTPSPETPRQLTLSDFRDLSTGDVFKNAAKNFFPSVGRNLGDLFKLVTSPSQLKELGLLLGEISGPGSVVGPGGIPTQAAIEASQNTPRLDAVIDFYKQNYGIGPENEGGFKRYVSEDPAGFLSDALGILSFGAGSAAKAGKAAQLASRLNANKYLVPLGRIGAGAERIGGGAQKVFDMADPIAAPIRLGGKVVQKGIQTGLDAAIGGNLDELADQRIIDLEQKYGLNLPASAKTENPRVALIEAAAIKFGDKTLIQKAKQAEEDLERLMQETVDNIAGARDLGEAGESAIAATKARKKAFDAFTGELYDKVEDAGDMAAVTSATGEILQNIVSERLQQSKSLRDSGPFEDLLDELDLEANGNIPHPKTVSGEGVIGNSSSYRPVFGADPSQKYRTRYKVVELDDLIPSQLDNGQVNPDFPQELQPRDRTRLASEVQIDQIARELEPESILVDIPTLNRGAPIVGADNIVESGNGRTLALRKARDQFPDNFARYRENLNEIAPQYGIKPESFAQMGSPVLVRERLSDVSRPAFVREAVEGGLELSPLERAEGDIRVLTDNDIGLLQVTADENIFDAISKPKNREFVNAMLDKVPLSSRSALVDAKGNLNQLGAERMKNALLGKTYDSRLLGSLIETKEPGMVNLQKALLSSLPQMAASEGLIRLGVKDVNLSISEDVSQAITKLRELRAENTSVSDFLSQQTFLSDDLTDTARQLLPIIDEGVKSPSKLARFLENYAQEVGKSVTVGQGELIPSAPISKEMIIANLSGKELGDIPDISEIFDQFVGQAAPEGGRAGDVLGDATEALKPWTLAKLRANRTKIGKQIDAEALHRTGNERFYRQLYGALTEDMNQTLIANNPDLGNVLREVNQVYEDGIAIIDSDIAKEVWTNRDSPSAVVPLLFKSSTTVEDIGRIKQIVGTTELAGIEASEKGRAAWRNMQAAALDQILDRARGRQDQWKPGGLMSQLRGVGKPKLEAIFGRQRAEALEELAEISQSFSKLTRVTEGSQTAFIQRVLAGATLGEVGLHVYGYGIEGMAVMLAGLVGSQAFRRWIASDAGQSWLLGREGGIRRGAAAVGRVRSGPIRAARQAAQAGQRLEEENRQGNFNR